MLHCTGDTSNQATAADGNDNLLDFGQLLQNLQTDGTLTSHNIGVIEGMGESIALLLAQTLGFSGGIVIHTGNQHNFCAVVLGGLNLADGRTSRHTDDGLHTQLGGGEGDTLCVVASGTGDNTALTLLCGQCTQFVVGTAQLKSTRQLQVFTLDIDIFAKGFSGVQGGNTGNISQCFACFLNHL